MKLTKEELNKLKEELVTTESRIEELKDELDNEYEKVSKTRNKIVKNCNHIIVVSDYDPEEGWEEDDDPTYYHTCIKCGLTTQKNNYLPVSYQTDSIYGYNTKAWTSAHGGQEYLKELLQEDPDMSDIEIVKRFREKFNVKQDNKKLKLTKENTSYSHS